MSGSGAPTRPPAPTEGMREVTCLFCGDNEERLRFREGPFRVVTCRGCDLTYVTPRVSEERLREMYQSEYWTSDRARDFGYTAYLADADLYRRTFRLRARAFEHLFTAPGRVLDVGCAAGFFLQVMAEKGWDTVGIEISEPMVSHARTALGLPDVRVGDLTTVDLEPGSFDLITLWDVVEHLEDPVDHLRRAAALLKPDGLVVLETQNVASLFARVLGRRWHHYKHEEHLYHFSPRTVSHLLEQAGLRAFENTARRGGKHVSVDFVVERVGKLHPLLSVLAAPLRLLGKLAFYVNLGDEMVVLARRA